MLTIRLSRVGKKKQPLYRFVIMDKQKDPWGKSLEILGTRNPRTKETDLKADRIKYWIEKGAQASDSVWNILVEQKVVDGKKRNVTHLNAKRQKSIADEKAQAAEAAAAKAAEAAKPKEPEAPAAEETPAAEEAPTAEEPKE